MISPFLLLRRLLECKPARLACLLLLLLLPDVAQAERLPLKAYTFADGLPNNVINKIVRDSRGFLWICTDEGLSLFDGYRFTNFGTNEGLPHPRVTDILETRGGDYWVATSGGLTKFNPNGVPGGHVADGNGTRSNAPRDPMFTIFTPDSDDRYTRSVTTLVEGRDGTIWCGTWRGLFRLAQIDGRASLLPVDIKLPTEYALSGLIGALLEDRHGTLWIGAASGLYRLWPDGSTARYGLRDGLPDESIHDLLEDRRGHLWVGTRHGGLFRLTTGVGHEPPVISHRYNSKNGLTTDWVFDLHESSDGKLLVGTNQGLVEFHLGEKQGGPSRVYTKRHGFTYHEISNVTEDREGNLWLGTINGAMKIARNGFLSFGEQDGINSVYSLFESGGELYAYGHVLGDRKASVFDGGKLDILNPGSETYWSSLGRFDGEHFTWLMPTALRGVDISWSDKPFVIQARTGEWWIGRYLFPRVRDFAELKNARPVAVYTTKDVARPIVYSIYEDSRGDVWISTVNSTGNGLARWERATRSVRDMAGTEGLPALKETLPISFQEDAAGNVWVGFNNNGGLARYAGGRFTVFTTDHGLPAGRINDLYLDRAGRLWIASGRGGLARVDDPTAATLAFINYTTEQGLSSNFTNAITEDQQGRIYVGTGRGLDRIIPATGRIKHFTTADGLVTGEIRTALSDRHGALWFGTTQGLSRFVPEAEQPSLPPPILINGLRLAGEKHKVSALGETEIVLPELGSGENQMQIDFVGLSLAPGESLRYQYKLEGADADWGAPTEQRTVNLASLAPGKYKFLVRAITSDGATSPQPAAVTFTILRPVWQRWWFLALTGALLISAAFALYRYRVARILELANVRTRIATDLHDDIGANLTKIAILSEVVKQQLDHGKGEKDDSLSSIARISRESVAAMSDIVWAVNPKRDSLRDLVRRMRRHAEEVFVTRDIKLDFAAPEPNLKLGVDVRRDLFLVFKEAVNNAVRHSGCSRVAIALAVSGQSLELEINDNGVAFDPKAENDGQGLTNMRERAKKLGGELELTSERSGGTRIRIRVPYARTARLAPPTSLR
ncbi:MAG: ligand-binding sensor domain-containing protein [Pyrinomonadaceae bacterium]